MLSTDNQERLAILRRFLPKGSTVSSIVTWHAPSGMSRRVRLLVASKRYAMNEGY